MLKYDRIDVSKGIDTNKTVISCERIICHYWYFLRINFRFQPKVCDGCQMTQTSMSFHDVAIFTVGENDYRIYFWSMTKSEAVDRIKNADLGEKGQP